MKTLRKKLNQVARHHDGSLKYHPARLSKNHQEILAGTLLGVISAVLIVAWGFGFIGNGWIFHKEQRLSSNPQPVTANAPVMAPTFETKLSKWSYSKGGEVFKPEEGFIFVVVDVEIRHHKESPRWLSPAIQSYLSDNQDQQYSLSPVETEKPFIARQYKPYEMAKGALGYQVPISARGLSWCYFLEDNKQFPVCIDLKGQQYSG